MISFKTPSSPKKQIYQSSTFLGADFTSEASNVDDTKSPNCENMIRSVPGKIRKRMGYEEVVDYGQPIYGVHYFSSTDTWLVHAGENLYSLNGRKGRQWTKVVDANPTVRSVLVEYYSGYTVGATDSGDVTTYTVGDPSHRFPDSGAPLAPTPPEAYTGYEYVGYDVKVWWATSSTLYLYYEYQYRLITTTSYEYVDNLTDENHIYLLDGNVENTKVGTGFALHRSVSFELNHKLLILDGTTAWLYDTDNELSRLADYWEDDTYYPSKHAYVPTLVISKDPKGYETENSETRDPLNLASSAFIESFYVGETSKTAKDFQMSFADLDSTEVQVWVMDAQGEFQPKEENTDFTVDRTEGVITFGTAPGKSPIEGQDNVRIQAYKTFSGYADRINHCSIGAMFGVNGAHDRIFVSGNPDSGFNDDGDPYTYINCDWWSWQYDPTYFPDTAYSKMGSDNSAIMGYSIINNYLAAHKDYKELTQSVLIREGDLVDDEPVFKLINTLQGAGAISKYCFSYLATEPVFLTKLGVYAITAQDITGEKYAQDRSYYLEGKLLKEENLEDAFAYVWKDYYILAVNNHLYILDGLQPMHTDKSRPYATRQYAGFYFTNIPASCFFEMDDYLYFGSMDGKIYRFFKDDKAIRSYADNGEPIYSVWETADISEKLFYKKKTYRYLALRCMPEIYSSVQIYAQKQGQWSLVKEDQTKLKYFSYKNLIYSKMTYSTDTTQRISATKVRLKKLDHVRFKFVNDVLYEPLGINDFAVEYTQAGNVK